VPTGRVAYTTGDHAGDTFGIRLVGVDGTRDRPPERCTGTTRADPIDGSPLADEIAGGGGDDTIRSRRGGIDVVSCGRGRDIVHADKRDHVARECERVIRR
jgi:hypothetical protein